MESTFESQKLSFDRLVPIQDVVVLRALIAIGVAAGTRAVQRRLDMAMSYMKVHQRLHRLHDEHKLIKRRTVFIQEDLLLKRRVIWEVPSETAAAFAPD